MINQLFGAYLVEQEVISEGDLKLILLKLQGARVKLGTIAVAEGIMTQSQVDEVNHLQVQMDKKFGDIAVEKGYLQEDKIGELLRRQGNSYLKFVQLLMEDKKLDLDEIENYAKDFQKSKGFSDAEIVALKNNEFEKIVPMFVPVRKPYVVDLIALVLRNMVRFVSGDFYIGTVKHVNEFAYKSIAGQRLVGDNKIVLAFASEQEEDGLDALAADFAHSEAEHMGEDKYDAIGEFANICNGLLATEEAEKGTELDMEPPFIYLNQKAEGDAYLVPLYLHGKALYIYVAVDDVIIGNDVHKITGNRDVQNAGENKGNRSVVIVDDSLFIRKTLREKLERAGYHIVGEAADGEEAIQAYKEYKPDILTLDITMPVMDGLEALKQIIAYDKDAKVIMVTAAGQQNKVIESLKNGAKKFIVKPFRDEELLQAMEDM